MLLVIYLVIYSWYLIARLAQSIITKAPISLSCLCSLGGFDSVPTKPITDGQILIVI